MMITVYTDLAVYLPLLFATTIMAGLKLDDKALQNTEWCLVLLPLVIAALLCELARLVRYIDTRSLYLTCLREINGSVEDGSQPSYIPPSFARLLPFMYSDCAVMNVASFSAWSFVTYVPWAMTFAKLDSQVIYAFMIVFTIVAGFIVLVFISSTLYYVLPRKNVYFPTDFVDGVFFLFKNFLSALAFEVTSQDRIEDHEEAVRRPKRRTVNRGNVGFVVNPEDIVAREEIIKKEEIDVKVVEEKEKIDLDALPDLCQYQPEYDKIEKSKETKVVVKQALVVEKVHTESYAAKLFGAFKSFNKTEQIKIALGMCLGIGYVLLFVSYFKMNPAIARLAFVIPGGLFLLKVTAIMFGKGFRLLWVAAYGLLVGAYVLIALHIYHAAHIGWSRAFIPLDVFELLLFVACYAAATRKTAGIYDV